jgi:ribosome-associated protein
MADDRVVRINAALAIPRAELELKATRSGGPGGQHVNTASTRIELVWDLAASPSIDATQRARLLARLATRLDSRGRLRLVAQGERSQLQNREAVVKRFAEVVRRALIVPRARKATKPTRAARERRLQQKKQRGDLKRERRRRDDE